MSTLKLTQEQKEANKLARIEAKKQAKEAARIEAEKTQKPVASITFNIEWKKSRIWGANPHLTADVIYKDGTRNYFNSTCGGCGYDKESTVIADIFNQTLKYKLWNLDFSRIKNSSIETVENPLPYGIHNYSGNNPCFGGGIGTNCYYRIAEAIGGKFERVGSGKTFDVYKYTDND